MRWKGYLCMAATLGVCLMSAAEASTYNVGVLTANPYTNFVSLPAGTGGFTDVYDFQVTTVSTGGGSVTNIALSFDSTQILNIFDLMMQVFDSNNIPMKEASASLSFPAPIGSYHAEVTGKVTGTSGGAYAVALVAQPVPVPAAVWLFGSGLLGLIGIARRKKA